MSRVFGHSPFCSSHKHDQLLACISRPSSSRHTRPAPFAHPNDKPEDLFGKMMIKVKTLTGKEVDIDVQPEWTIAKVKERVEEKAGIPPVQQRLIYGGKAMVDEKTIADYKIPAGAAIHLVLALRGGRL